MIKYLNIRLLPMICILLAVGVIASCKKTNDANSGRVELLSFGPTGAMHGDTLFFIGNNLNKVTSIEFTGATVMQNGFLQQTSENILVIVPHAAEQGYVTLKTPDGDIITKTRLNLEVATTVTSLTAEARPGTAITINGDKLNWVTSITFPEDIVVVADSFVSKTINQIVVMVPEGAQTGTLVLNYAGTEPGDVETTDTLKVTLPVATAMAPNPIKHQTDLTITGTNLDLTKEIRFTGVATPVTTFTKSATQIVVKVPASAQKGKITLVAASGVTTQSPMEMNVVLPAITTMAPNPVDPGTNITITGTNLDLVTSVTFANAPAVTTFVSKTATQIVVQVPMGILRGKITLGVLNSTLIVQSNDVLEVMGAAPPPTIALPIFNDVVTSNWSNAGGWTGAGWGGTNDYNNTAPVREGSKSVKVNYVGGWGAPFQLGGANLSTTGYTTLKISIYGAPGSGGKKVNLGINNADGPTITIDEGKWTDYEFPISSLTSAGKITDIIVKEFNGSGGFSIYVDALGLN